MTAQQQASAAMELSNAVVAIIRSASGKTPVWELKEADLSAMFGLIPEYMAEARRLIAIIRWRMAGKPVLIARWADSAGRHEAILDAMNKDASLEKVRSLDGFSEPSLSWVVYVDSAIVEERQ